MRELAAPGIETLVQGHEAKSNVWPRDHEVEDAETRIIARVIGRVPLEQQRGSLAWAVGGGLSAACAIGSSLTQHLLDLSRWYFQIKTSLPIGGASCNKNAFSTLSKGSVSYIDDHSSSPLAMYAATIILYHSTVGEVWNIAGVKGLVASMAVLFARDATSYFLRRSISRSSAHPMLLPMLKLASPAVAHMLWHRLLSLSLAHVWKSMEGTCNGIESRASGGDSLEDSFCPPVNVATSLIWPLLSLKHLPVVSLAAVSPGALPFSSPCLCVFIYSMTAYTIQYIGQDWIVNLLHKRACTQNEPRSIASSLPLALTAPFLGRRLGDLLSLPFEYAAMACLASTLPRLSSEPASKLLQSVPTIFSPTLHISQLYTFLALPFTLCMNLRGPMLTIFIVESIAGGLWVLVGSLLLRRLHNTLEMIKED